MRRPTLMIAAVATTLAATVGAAGFAAASTTTTTATAAVVSFRSFEAHPASGGRVEFEAKTSAATKVTFRYRGATFTGRADGDDTDEWKRTVRRRGGDGVGDRITVRVRACDSSGCRSKTYRSVIHSDDNGGDDDRGGGDNGGGSDDD